MFVRRLASKTFRIARCPRCACCGSRTARSLAVPLSSIAKVVGITPGLGQSQKLVTHVASGFGRVAQGAAHSLSGAFSAAIKSPHCEGVSGWVGGSVGRWVGSHSRALTSEQISSHRAAATMIDTEHGAGLALPYAGRSVRPCHPSRRLSFRMCHLVPHVCLYLARLACHGGRLVWRWRRWSSSCR